MAEQPQEQSMPTWATMSEQADPLPGPTTLATHTRGPRYSRSRSSRSNTNSAASSRSVSRSRVESNPLNDHVNLVGGHDELDQTTNDLGTELDVEIPDNMDVDDNAYDDEDEDADADGEDYIFDDSEEHANSPQPPLSLPGEVHSTEGVPQSEHSTIVNDARSLLTDLIQCRTSITNNVVSNNTHPPIHLPVDPGSSTQPAYTHNRSNSSSSSHKMHLDSILSPTTPHSTARGSSGHNSAQNKYGVNDIGSSMAGADIIELYDTPSSLGKRRANTFISDGNNEIASFDLTQSSSDVQILDHKGKSSDSQNGLEFYDLVDDVDSSYVQTSSQEKKGKGKEKEEEEPPFSIIELGEGSSGGKKRRIEIDDTKFDNSLLPKGPEEEEEGEESWSLRDVPTTHDFHTIDPSTIAGPSTLPYPSESHSPDKSSRSRKKKRHDARVKSKSKSKSPSPHRNVISLLSSPTIPSSPINIYRQPESATFDDVIDLVSPVRSSHPIEILPSPPAATNNKRVMITSTTTGSSSSLAASSAAVAVTTPTTTTVTTTTTTTTAAATAAASSQVQTTPPKPKQPIHTSQPISEFCCPICFCSPTNATLTLCGHVFCGPCLFAAVRAAPQSNVYQPAGTPPKYVKRAPVFRF